MKKAYTIIVIIICFMSCKNKIEEDKIKFLTDIIPADSPIVFKAELIPENKIIHKGIFSPDFSEYYYTISDKDYNKFDVYVIKKTDGVWSEPQEAFFNSKYSEHGMCFSPDGNSIYFSSTRPTNSKGVIETWHIWKSEKVNGKWTNPEFVDIPNLKDKLVSHPTITKSGTIYFHSANPDYSEMDIYYSKSINGKYTAAEKILLSMNSYAGRCTPYISPDEDYLIFAEISNQLDLIITYNNGKGNWTGTKRLNKKINTNGQGNPFVTPDNKYLFFTTGDNQGKNWNVQWVNIESEILAKR